MLVEPPPSATSAYRPSGVTAVLSGDPMYSPTENVGPNDGGSVVSSISRNVPTPLKSATIPRRPSGVTVAPIRFVPATSEVVTVFVAISTTNAFVLVVTIAESPATVTVTCPTADL